MGTFGTSLYQDDEALDLKAAFEQLWRMGLILRKARALLATFADPSSTVFWLVLADLQWKSGHIEPEVIKKACQVIDSGEDLIRWEPSPKDLAARKKILLQLKSRLLTSPAKKRKAPDKYLNQTDWQLGELLSYPLQNGKFIVMRVAGYYTKFGGKSPVVEILDWYRDALPTAEQAQALPLMPIATHVLLNDPGQLNQVRLLPADLDQDVLKRQLAEAKHAGQVENDVSFEMFLEHETHPFLPLIRLSENDRYYRKARRLNINTGLKRRYIPHLVNRISNIYREWRDFEAWLEDQFALEGKLGMVGRFRDYGPF